MHESLVVIMMILTPTAGMHSSVIHGWQPGGYYPTKAACEDMAQRIYKQQKILSDRTSRAHTYDTDIVRNNMIGHVCGDDPVPPVKK